LPGTPPASRVSVAGGFDRGANMTVRVVLKLNGLAVWMRKRFAFSFIGWIC
jgi:hypothetical protein